MGDRGHHVPTRAVHRAGPRAAPAMWLTWAALGAAVFVLALLFPPTSDDWRRIAFPDRSVGGYLEQAITSYNGHNGRIVGNTLSFLLIDPAWVRALAKAVTVVALVAVTQRLIQAPTERGPGSPRGHSVWLGLAIFAGVFLLPAGVFRESYVWSAGFFNYLPPLLGILWLVGSLSGRWPSHDRSWVAGVTCGLVAFASALFVEHVNVALLGLAVGGVVWALFVHRKSSAAMVGWLIGAVIGSWVMFASPGLVEVFNHDDAYFSYPQTIAGALDKAVTNYSVITRSFLFSNGVLMTWLVALGVATRRSRGILLLTGAIALYGMSSRVLAPGSLLCAGPTMDTCQRRMLAADAVALFAALALVVWLGLRLLAKVDVPVFVGLLAATLLMLGPLLVVSPIGPRNLVGPTITLVALLALLSRPLLEGRGPGLRAFRVACLVGVMGLLSLYFVIQEGNARVSAERVALMEAAVTERADKVVLPRFPYPDWVHDPDDPKIGNRYFRHAPRDIELELRPER